MSSHGDYDFPHHFYHHTFEEIGEELGLTKQSVERIYKRAIEKLRASGALEEFRDLVISSRLTDYQ